MVSVPYELMTAYIELLGLQGIPKGHVENYQKWLRYFYDFSARYLHEQERAVKVRLFLEKLKSKGQSSAQCQQAAHAVALYFELLVQNAPVVPTGVDKNHTDAASPIRNGVVSVGISSGAAPHRAARPHQTVTICRRRLSGEIRLTRVE